jgi:hypothetical protein
MCASLQLILGYFYPVHDFIPYFTQVSFNSIILSTSASSGGLFCHDSIGLCILISRMRTICSDFLILKVRDNGILIKLLTFWILSIVPFLYLKQQLCLRPQVKRPVSWALKR